MHLSESDNVGKGWNDVLNYGEKGALGKKGLYTIGLERERETR